MYIKSNVTFYYCQVDIYILHISNFFFKLITAYQLHGNDRT
jgi:hypothetical protein